MSKLAVPDVFIFYRDALDTYARLTATPAEAALRVLLLVDDFQRAGLQDAVRLIRKL